MNGGSPKRPRSTRLLVVGAFAAGLAAFFVLGGQRYLHLETIEAERDALRAFADTHLALALALSFAVYAGIVALSVPGAAVLSLASGFVFGRWLGTVLIVAAATTGATIVFLAARYVVGDWAARRLGKTGARIREGFVANAWSYLLFLRLVPAFPFFLVNLALAFTEVPIRTYVLATMIGIIPGSFVYANLGEALGRIDTSRSLVSPSVIVAFALLAALSLVPVVVRRLRHRSP